MDIEKLISSVPAGIYWLFVFISSFLENIFPPYPGDTVTVFGGYLAGRGIISIWALSLSVYTGSMAGALVMYFFGKKILDFFSHHTGWKAIREFTDPENFHKVEAWFLKYGIMTVIFSRFSAGIRFFVAVFAGMVKMNLSWFIISFSLATLLWNFLLVYGGYLLGDNWPRVMHYLKIYNWVIGGVIVLAVLIFLVLRFRSKRRQNSDGTKKS